MDGNRAYGLDIMGQTGYRDDNTRGIAVNGQPEGMYMVASDTHVNSGCCFDFGNSEISNDDTGNGHMDAVNLGMGCWAAPCAGLGPWVRADLENGLYAGGGNGSNPNNLGNNSEFVTAMLKNDGQKPRLFGYELLPRLFGFACQGSARVSFQPAPALLDV